MAQLQEHGAIWFRNFESTKDAEGFRGFYEALQLNPCLDPIHTSGLRAMEPRKHAVYEAVNKPSLAGHFVGLHNESTFVKTATYGAFVCFEPASEGGGEFLVADGAKIVNDLDKDVLERIYNNKASGQSNLDLNFLGALPEGFRESTADFLQDLILKVVAPKFDMDLEMIYGADQSNPYRLQAIEHAQSPINKHPVTGQPVWFCNLHNHSRYLRDRRPCTVPEVGMTDVYSGDLSTIPYDDVRHINEVCERNIVSMSMKQGDVVLLDNYRVLHGRNTFKGDRKHAVTWFESCGEPLARGEVKDTPDDFMNTLINKTLV
ncbi:ddaC [Symbiodinium natans]|uniref:DdaC protein n=1 Tax=Symbiodinium natans TaxID=878477 RepID=A0A812JKG9_9DINO|nr:ddaC [Symbiodinium natans]